MAALAEVSNNTSSELDEPTLERARRGDRAACHRFVECYQRRVVALVARLLGDARATEIEDITQETFLRSLRALPEFRTQGPARLSTWLLTIATRLALKELQRRQRFDAHESPEFIDASNPERLAHDRALGKTVADAIGRLPADQRATVILRGYHGFSYDEISRALECDVGTVKSRLSRARGRLRKALSGGLHD